MSLPSIEAVVYVTNRLIIDELAYDTNMETSRFEVFVRGLNLDQYHAYRSVFNTHNRGDGGCSSYMIVGEWERLIYGIS